jgi:hypothetical protein
MANKTVLEIPVNDEQFKAFFELYKEFHANVEELPESWRAVGESAEAAQKVMGDQAQALTGHMKDTSAAAGYLAHNLEEAKKAQRNFTIATGESETVMKRIGKEAKELKDTVFGIGSFLMKLGVLGVGSVAGGLFGMEKLANAAVGGQRQARSLGVTQGELQAFRSDYGRYLDESALENIANAKNDLTQRVWLQRATGLSGQQIDQANPAQLASQLALRAHDWWASTPESQHNTAFLQTTGFSQLGFSLDDLRRLGATPRSELERAQTQFQHDRNTLGITNAATDSLYAFERQLVLAGQHLEKDLGDRLSVLGPSLGSFVFHLEEDAEKLINGVLTPSNLDKVQRAIENIAAYLGSDDFRKTLKEAGHDIAAFAGALWDAAKFIAHLFPNAGIPSPDASGNGLPTNAAQASQPPGTLYFDNPDHGNPTSSVFHSGNYKTTGGLFSSKQEYMGPYYEDVNPTTSAGRTNLAYLTQLEKKYGLPAGFLSSVISTESSFNKNAVSPAGAIGIMQLMPDVIKQYGVKDPFDFRENADAGAHYLSDLMRRFHGDARKALAGYNWGPNRQALNSNDANWEAGINPGVEAYIRRVLKTYAITSPKEAANLAASSPSPSQAQMGQIVGILARPKPAQVNLTVTNTTGSNVALSTNAAAGM